MKKDNKGFSLVELIIVIAIMVVLVGILAPTYMRFVAKSKVSADGTNAQEIATAFNAAISEGEIGSVTVGGTAVTSPTTLAPGATVAGLSGFTTVPDCKVTPGARWVVTWDTTDGVSAITLGGVDIYPDNSEYGSDAAHTPTAPATP